MSEKYCDTCGLPESQCICDESEPYEGACPNCGAVWGMEELDWNRCAACGWPDNDDIYEYPDYGDPSPLAMWEGLQKAIALEFPENRERQS